MITKETVSQLEESLRKAESARYVLKTKVEDEAYVARRDAGNAVTAKYAAEVDTAARAVDAAQLAVNEAKTALASVDTGWFPLGTRVQRTVTKYGGSGYWTKGRDEIENGVVECWSPASQFTDNRSGWRDRPKDGEVVGRLFKKDGTPSKKYVSLGARNMDAERKAWTEVK